MHSTNRVEQITLERRHIERITITKDNIKDPKVLSTYLEEKCNIITKKSDNRPWLYMKDSETLKTLGGVRLNKNSIGTFYIDTKIGHPLNEELIGFVSKENKNYITNRIIVNDLPTLERVCDIINNLIETGAVYLGKRN
jgi:hypothetical protein